MTVQTKTPEEVAKMRVAGRLASEVLDFIAAHVRPGITTDELDALCHEYMVKGQSTIPAPLNYAPPGYQPYPKSICTSVNQVVCHGVPGPKRLKAGDIVNVDITVIKDGFHGDTSRMFYVGEPSIQARRLCEITYQCMWLGIQAVRPGAYLGDIVNIDITVIKEGWHGDTSRMFYVGEPSIQARRLCEITYQCMWLGIQAVRPDAHLGDIGHAIQSYAEEHGFSVVREFCGHGIGRKFHEEPQVLHYGRPQTGLRLQPGMIFTVEPMINAGKAGIRQLADGWTIVTKDHSLSAQWEHTVLVTDSGFEVLTVSVGTPEPARLAA